MYVCMIIAFFVFYRFDAPWYWYAWAVIAAASEALQRENQIKAIIARLSQIYFLLSSKLPPSA